MMDSVLGVARVTSPFCKVYSKLFSLKQLENITSSKTKLVVESVCDSLQNQDSLRDLWNSRIYVHHTTQLACFLFLCKGPYFVFQQTECMPPGSSIYSWDEATKIYIVPSC